MRPPQKDRTLVVLSALAPKEVTGALTNAFPAASVE